MDYAEKRIRHASKNIRFLEEFFRQYKHNDWAVTVCFYSIVHVVEHAIAKKGVITYKGIRLPLTRSSDLFDAVKKKRLDLTPLAGANAKYRGRHGYRLFIIQENFKQITAQYNLIYNDSQTARYIDYQITDYDTNNHVLGALETILDWSNKMMGTSLGCSLLHRKHFRRSLNTSVSVAVDGRITNVTVSDISADGIGLNDVSVCSEGEALQMTFQEGHEDVFTVKGKCLRVDRARQCSGVQFMDLSPDLKKMLEKLN